MLDFEREKREKSFRRKENVVPQNRGFTDDYFVSTLKPKFGFGSPTSASLKDLTAFERISILGKNGVRNAPADRNCVQGRMLRESAQNSELG